MGFSWTDLIPGYGAVKRLGEVTDAVMGSNNAPPAPPPIPMPQTPKPEDVAQKAQNISNKKRAAASQSIYTSPLGVGGEANVARKTLLGQ